MGGGDRAERAATRYTCDGGISIALMSLTTCDPNCGRKNSSCNAFSQDDFTRWIVSGTICQDKRRESNLRQQNNQSSPAQTPTGRKVSRTKNSNDPLAG